MSDKNVTTTGWAGADVYLKDVDGAWFLGGDTADEEGLGFHVDVRDIEDLHEITALALEELSFRNER